MIVHGMVVDRPGLLEVDRRVLEYAVPGDLAAVENTRVVAAIVVVSPTDDCRAEVVDVDREEVRQVPVSTGQQVAVQAAGADLAVVVRPLGDLHGLEVRA